MNEIDKEYILNQLNDGYIDLGIHDEKEIEYLKLVVSNYENLQSKIDKTIEFCDYSFKNPWYVSEKELLGKIIDILKED